MSQIVVSTLSHFPEELQERILEFSVAAPQSIHFRPSWHASASTSGSASGPSQGMGIRSRTAPLLVCKRWLRIATPLVYHTILIRSQEQAAHLFETLRNNLALGNCVRKIIVGGCWAIAGDIVAMCPQVQALDFTIDVESSNADESDNASEVNGIDADAKVFCDTLERLNPKHITVRKPSGYLTQPRSVYILTRLSCAILGWRNLESANIAFRLSHDVSGASVALSAALASVPRLRVFRTHLPSIWNPILLTVSQNPKLERIQLSSGKVEDVDADEEPEVIVGTGLYLMEARKYVRLSELIRAGTPMIRTRAHTMGTIAPNANINSRVLSASTAKDVPRAQQPTQVPAPRTHVRTGSFSARRPRRF